LLIGGVGIVIGLGDLTGYRLMRPSAGTSRADTSRGFARRNWPPPITVVGSIAASACLFPPRHTLGRRVLGVVIARALAHETCELSALIFSSWLITLPAGAGFSIVYFSLSSPEIFRLTLD